MKKYLLLIISIVLFFACEDKQEKDCAGVEAGNNICGCTDINALNYVSIATFNDGSCEYDTSPPTISSITIEDDFLGVIEQENSWDSFDFSASVN